MASVRNEFPIEASPEAVWAAVRDVGAVHLRLATGFVVDTRLEGDARIVTFANGLVARELIVDVDDKARRLVWAAVGGRASHYNASLQVFADGEGRSRAIWIADFLPNDLLSPIGAMVEQGSAAIQRTLERTSADG
jgi:carbon monoxide dehydrogenase subunit G